MNSLPISAIFAPSNSNHLNAPKRYTVTAALPYANGPVHIGHLAGCYIPADTYVRFLRLMGKDVLFICGSDEHGVPITLKARDLGIKPQDVVDKYHKLMGDAFADLGISFDIYSRTSAPIHHETAQEFFLNLYHKGEFTEQVTEQFFDEQEQTFLADRYIIGTCPNCANENAYGDQCEKCGKSLSPSDLINPRSKLSGNAPVKKSTKHWFLPLDKYQNDWINDWMLTQKDKWKSNVYGQCKSWLDQGLQPRAITRDLEWGVKVPLEGEEGKVLYVWFDAPIGYISASREWSEKTGKDWKPYWQDEHSQLVHFIGKDNIVFHCIIFPAILKAHGDYILPDQVPANEFLNLEGEKISTSRNWAVWLHEYLQDFPGRRDELRYVLSANAPETKDNDFTWTDFKNRVNNELADNLGNYVNRVISLVNRYFEGETPNIDSELLYHLESKKDRFLGLFDYTSDYDYYERSYFQILNPTNKDLYNKSIKGKLERLMENYKIREAFYEIMMVSRSGNWFLQEKAPWKLVKDFEENRVEIESNLNYSLQYVANFAILLKPFLPDTSIKIFRMLNINPDLYGWDDIGRLDLIKTGHKIGEPEILFKKIEDSEVELQLQKLEASKAARPQPVKAHSPVKSAISYDDFMKMDIRVGTILEAVKVPKADKLLKLLVDTGVDKRTVVSGIAEHFAPEAIIGQQVSLLLNLEPRKIKGIESQGMILMAEDSDGKLKFVQPGEVVNPGSEIR